MHYVNTSIGNTSDSQLEKNIVNIRQQILSGDITQEERLSRQIAEIDRLHQLISCPKNRGSKKSNIKRLDYIIREYNATKEIKI